MIIFLGSFLKPLQHMQAKEKLSETPLRSNIISFVALSLAPLPFLVSLPICSSNPYPNNSTTLQLQIITNRK
jgi:hypothetical protein